MSMDMGMRMFLAANQVEEDLDSAVLPSVAGLVRQPRLNMLQEALRKSRRRTSRS